MNVSRLGEMGGEGERREKGEGKKKLTGDG